MSTHPPSAMNLDALLAVGNKIDQDNARDRYEPGRSGYVLTRWARALVEHQGVSCEVGRALLRRWCISIPEDWQ